MNSIIFIIMRKMRRPLLTLTLVYVFSILGLTLIPGVDDAGNTWYMSFFHAFYFMSFMSTTTGFGEIPYAFTDAQRLWVTFSLYAAVIAWVYALGAILQLVTDRGFLDAINSRGFAKKIREIKDPFYLICGYGETAAVLVRALTERGQNAVVIDSDQDRLNLLKLEQLRRYVPALHANVKWPENLAEAGIEHPKCQGVVALTSSNEINLKVAITSKLLNPDLKVISRADSHEVEENMASFGTDFIIDPYDSFAAHLAIALQSPCLYLLQEWLTGVNDMGLSEPIYPPKDGHWIICGFGRFGSAVYERLDEEGIETVVIEATPEKTGMPPEGFVKGTGTDAKTLQQARIEDAVGLVAGTDSDTNNLSIVMTALELKPSLFVIVRQNRQKNDRIAKAVKADILMHPSSIVAERIRVLLATPLLHDFLNLARFQDETWACQLVSRISAIVSVDVPLVREYEISKEKGMALDTVLQAGDSVRLGSLLVDSARQQLAIIPLMLKRRGERILLPGDDVHLRSGDQLLFCGDGMDLTQFDWILGHQRTLEYVRTGRDRPTGWFWRKFMKR